MRGFWKTMFDSRRALRNSCLMRLVGSLGRTAARSLRERLDCNTGDWPQRAIFESKKLPQNLNKNHFIIISSCFLNFWTCVCVCGVFVRVRVCGWLCSCVLRLPSRFLLLFCSTSACKATGTSRRVCALGLLVHLRLQLCAAAPNEKSG